MSKQRAGPRKVSSLSFFSLEVLGAFYSLVTLYKVAHLIRLLAALQGLPPMKLLKWD